MSFKEKVSQTAVSPYLNSETIMTCKAQFPVSAEILTCVQWLKFNFPKIAGQNAVS